MQSAQSGGALKGAAFWELFADGQVAPAAEGGGSGLYGVKSSDSTFAIIAQNAQFMRTCAAPPILSLLKQGQTSPCFPQDLLLPHAPSLQGRVRSCETS